MGCLLVALVAVGLAFRYADERDGGLAGPPVTFDVELGDLYVKPSSIEVPAGSPVVLTVTNAGAMSHDLQVGGTDGTRMLAPGESQEVTVGPFEADAQAWCTVPGHREAGMVMDIRVTGATAGSAGLAAAAAVSTDSSIDFNAEPPPGWKPFDPALQPAPGGPSTRSRSEPRRPRSRWLPVSSRSCGRSTRAPVATDRRAVAERRAWRRSSIPGRTAVPNPGIV